MRDDQELPIAAERADEGDDAVERRDHDGVGAGLDRDPLVNHADRVLLIELAHEHSSDRGMERAARLGDRAFRQPKAPIRAARLGEIRL